MKKLSARDKRFIDEYLIDLNPERAAIAAGYAKSVAETKAYCWVSNSKSNDKPHLFEAIRERQEKLSAKTEITQEMIIAEYGRLAFSNVGNYIRWNESGVELFDSDQLTEDAKRCVLEVSQTVTESGGTVKFKLHDKKGALDSLSRHLGLFMDKQQLLGPGGGPIETVDLTERQRKADEEAEELLRLAKVAEQQK